MSHNSGLRGLAVSVLLEVTAVWALGSLLPWGATVVVMGLRAALPVIGLISARRWAVYVGAVIAALMSAVFWFLILIPPILPIGCLVVARGMQPRLADSEASGAPS